MTSAVRPPVPIVRDSGDLLIPTFGSTGGPVGNNSMDGLVGAVYLILRKYLS